jgi:hypothetical protein
MKKLITEWRLYEQQILWEQEFEEFFNEHYLMLDEGAIDWVLQKGRQVKDTVVNTVSAMKDWTGEKIEAFVKFMINKLRKLMQGLRNKGLLGKWAHKKELAAINLLGTRKHIDLAVMLLSAIAKITGGFIVDKVAKLPEILEKIKELLENPIVALKDLIGDVKDIKTIIDKFVEYRKDRKIVDTGPMDWADYGGLL